MNHVRTAILTSMAASSVLASMPLHVMRRANLEGDEDVLVVGNDIENVDALKAAYHDEGELARMSREIDDKIARRRPYNPPVGKTPDPVRQAAAEAKRARKAEELRRLAENGAIGVQKTTTISADPFPGDKPAKKTRAKEPTETTGKAPTAKGADKTKTPAKRKTPTKDAK